MNYRFNLSGTERLLQQLHDAGAAVDAAALLPEDTIKGTSGNDSLNGTSGKDWINGRAGADTMVGGDRSDTYVVDNVGDVVVELAGGGGNDTVRSKVAYTLGTEVENLKLLGQAMFGTGNAKDNVIRGSDEGHNILKGEGGDDTIEGGAGDFNNQLYGGDGDDLLTAHSYSTSLRGDAGNDTLDGTDGVSGDVYGGDGDDLLMAESFSHVDGGTGADTVRADFVYLGFGGDGDDFFDLESFRNINGGSGNDTLTGERLDGPSTMAGGDGNDLLLGRCEEKHGGNGDDTITGSTWWTTGGSGSDTFLCAGTYNGRITDFASGLDRVGVDRSVYAVGNGDLVVDETDTLPDGVIDGFSSTAEVVKITDSSGDIGTADSAYAVGDSAIFVVDNGDNTYVYYFKSLDNDAEIEAGELFGLAGIMNSNVAASDIAFV